MFDCYEFSTVISVLLFTIVGLKRISRRYVPLIKWSDNFFEKPGKHRIQIELSEGLYFTYLLLILFERLLIRPGSTGEATGWSLFTFLRRMRFLNY